MARRSSVLIPISWLVLCAASATAQEPKALVQQFERTYRSARTLQATFLERYLDNGREVRAEAGAAYFARPGKMRWEYGSAERNLYVVDGKWSWFYVPADHSATRMRAKESSDWRTPLALLAGEMKVSRICSRVFADPEATPVEHGNVVFQCVLRGSETPVVSAKDNPGKNAADQVLFELNASTGELARILVSDPGGIQIEFRFAHWRFDPPLAAALFRFEPPKGVAIVDGDLALPGSPPSGSPSPRSATR